jgi:hypothetical protein
MCALRLEYNDLGFELYDNDQCLTVYRAKENIPREQSPKPCFHPIYTPSGSLITEYRPEDHLWHTGLYFGWVHVNDANLWGGPWYLPEKKKYERVENSHGIQRHDSFSNLETANNKICITEELTWLDQNDHILVKETRSYTFQTLKDMTGYLWLIKTELCPMVDEVTLGASRAARYSGLELRMGPPFSDAVHHSSEGIMDHEAIMKQPARWVSASGAEGGMVIMMDHPENPRHPVTWFARKNLLGAGLLMEEDLTIRKPDTLQLKYGFAILDKTMDRDEIDRLYTIYLS